MYTHDLASKSFSPKQYLARLRLRLEEGYEAMSSDRIYGVELGDKTSCWSDMSVYSTELSAALSETDGCGKAIGEHRNRKIVGEYRGLDY